MKKSMRNKKFLLSYKHIVVLLLVVVFISLAPTAQADSISAGSISGRVLDIHDQPISDVEVTVYLDGSEQSNIFGKTNLDGVYLIDIPTANFSEIKIEVSHPHFRSEVVTPENMRDGTIRIPDIQMERVITAAFWISIAVFIIVLILIITEKMNSALAALLGAGILISISLVGGAFNNSFYIFEFEKAIEYIDFNVIFLILGMMIIVGIIEHTGVFQWVSYYAYQVSRGSLVTLVILLMIFTSIASALLDNVTTMLLVVPITIQIALTLGINPIALLIPEMLVSNVGGIATLIGTPNNILIGSYAGLGFSDFIRDLTPGVLIIQVILTIFVLIVYSSQYKQTSEIKSDDLLAVLKENSKIRDPKTLRNAGIVFIFTLFLFAVGESIHLIPSVTALIGAAVTLIIVKADVDEILRVVDWSTLLFFMSLFMIVGAIQEVGLISIMAAKILELVAGDLLVATLVVLWGTGLLCLVVPTIPLTAALLPVVGFLSSSIPGASNTLFYSLSLGSALGANNSLIGATNNLISAGIAKRAGFPISYKDFLKIGFPAAMLTLTAATIYVLIRF